MIRFVGGLGPLQGMGVSGAITRSFEAHDGGTRITSDYVVSGFLPGGFEKLAPAVDSGIQGQISRLATWASGAKMPSGRP